MFYCPNNHSPSGRRHYCCDRIAPANPKVFHTQMSEHFNHQAKTARPATGMIRFSIRAKNVCNRSKMSHSLTAMKVNDPIVIAMTTRYTMTAEEHVGGVPCFQASIGVEVAEEIPSKRDSEGDWSAKNHTALHDVS
jgi:hypothetical protein